MEHSVTWFSYLPGARELEAYLRHAQEGALGKSGGLLFGSPVVVQHVLASILVCLVIFLVSLSLKRSLKQQGEGALIPLPKVTLQNLIETALEYLYLQMHSIIGKEASRYFPVISALALFIFFSNALGLIPGFTPPTDNWNTTLACGLFVFLYYNAHGLRAHGLGHIAHMANPAGTWWGWFLAPLLFPIELVSHIARPASLAIRLAANMVGDHAVVTAFLGLVPILVPLPFMALGLMVCVVQTLVFVLLTTVYISLSVSGDDEHAKVHTSQTEEPVHS